MNCCCLCFILLFYLLGTGALLPELLLLFAQGLYIANVSISFSFVHLPFYCVSSLSLCRILSYCLPLCIVPMGLYEPLSLPVSPYPKCARAVRVWGVSFCCPRGVAFARLFTFIMFIDPWLLLVSLESLSLCADSHLSIIWDRRALPSQHTHGDSSRDPLPRKSRSVILYS